MGVEIRRKWEMVAEKLRRFSTCETPTLFGPPILPEPKLPVAREDFKHTSMMVDLMILLILLIFTISDQFPVAFHDPP